MFWRIVLRLVFLIGWFTCLAVGYTIAGQWIALPGVLLALTAWLLAYKWRSGWLAGMALVLSVCLAAAGLFAPLSPVLMILSATLALAGWDRVFLDQRLMDNPSDRTVDLLEKRHYQSLALVLAVGLPLALAGRMFRIHIGFGWMIFLVILALIGLERLWRMLIG